MRKKPDRQRFFKNYIGRFEISPRLTLKQIFSEQFDSRYKTDEIYNSGNKLKHSFILINDFSLKSPPPLIYILCLTFADTNLTN